MTIAMMMNMTNTMTMTRTITMNIAFSAISSVGMVGKKVNQSLVCNGRWNERSGRLSFGGVKNGLRSWTESRGPLGPRDSVQLQRPFWTPPNDRRPQFSFQRPAYCYICDCHKSSEVRQEKRTMAASFDVCRKYNSMTKGWLFIKGHSVYFVITSLK